MGVQVELKKVGGGGGGGDIDKGENQSPDIFS